MLSINEYWNTLNAVETRANELWFNDLKLKFSDINPKIFQRCYDEAYNRYHSEGWDAIIDGIDTYVSFAKDCEIIWQENKH